MKASILPFLFIAYLSLISCSGNASGPSTDSSSVSSSVSSSSVTLQSSSSINSGVEKNLLSEKLFDEDSIRTYEILIDSDSLAKIDANPTAEEYVQARAFIVGSDTIGPVGIRYKGNEGAWWGCTSEQLSGYKTCAKLPMKIKINWNRDTTFFGMKKFQLQAMNTYTDQLREKVGYWFYRRMGVAAPRVAHIRLKINGKEAGLFAHVEEIDGRFTNYHFDDGSGNLYKELWPLADDMAASESLILNALETNEDAPNVSLFKNFALAVAAADSSSIRNVIDTYMDIDQILRLAAVSYALDDDDGPFHWYSTGYGNFARPHNFYTYEDPSTQKIRMIPWDLDHMLSSVAMPDTMNAVELRDGWGEISNNCQVFGQGWPQKSAACDKLVAGWVTYKTEYQSILQELLSGPFVEIDTVLARWEAQLRPVTADINSKDSRFIDPANWESSLLELHQELATAKALLQAKLSP